MSDSEEKYRQAFNQLDDDGDGVISPDGMGLALRFTYSEMDEFEFQNMHALATMGGHRGLGQQEFVSFMQLMDITKVELDPLPTRAVQLYYLIHDASEAVGREEIAKLDPIEHNLTLEEVNILTIIVERLQHRGVEMIGFARLWRDIQTELQNQQ